MAWLLFFSSSFTIQSNPILYYQITFSAHQPLRPSNNFFSLQTNKGCISRILCTCHYKWFWLLFQSAESLLKCFKLRCLYRQINYNLNRPHNESVLLLTVSSVTVRVLCKSAALQNNFVVSVDSLHRSFW